MSAAARTVSITVLVAVLVVTALTVRVTANTETFRLENGMEVILKENHSSPMVASVVFVKSGSKYESNFENGITHFLEHLLFDGTVNQSREELDASISDLGGYINAFTAKDMTGYLVLLPKQFIEYGLAVQADMLFCSTLPEEELPKERKVVMEEINRSADYPGSAAQAFFTEKAYAGTPYSRPVLGFKPFIENIPREAIIAYWKQAYTPDNMIMLVIGDFDSGQMKETVTGLFGAFSGMAAADSPAALPGAESRSGPQVILGAGLSGRNVYDTVANVTSTYVDFSFAAPHYQDQDYVPFNLLTEYLALDEISPLKRALTAGADPLATEVSVSLVTRSEFSRLEVSVILQDTDRADRVVETVVGELSGLGSRAADPEALEGIKTSVKCSNIYNTEKLHYYGFIIAPMIMTAGWDFIEQYPDLLSRVTWAQCQQAAHKWLDQPDFVATTVRPVGESGQPPYVPDEIMAEEVTGYFDTVTLPQYDLTALPALSFPATDSVKFELDDRASYVSEVLENGLTLIIKSGPDSRVFGMTVLGKGRTVNEPEGKAGITDFVNRCLEKGTLTRSASEFSRDLARIGANLTLYDNPWIPFDDRYTTRGYSFIKFETIDEYAGRGFGLLVDMLLYPAFDSAEVEKVRARMLGTIGRDATSPTNVARESYYQALFENKPYAQPIMGSARSIAGITREDLRRHHANVYSPENVILSIVTNLSVEEVRGWVRATLGRVTPVEFVSRTAEKADPLATVKERHVDLAKEQVSIYLGSALPGAGSADAVALAVATSILSERLFLNLREKQGLAYSTGASAHFDRDFGWYYCTIGTASNNYRTALDGLLLQIDKLKLDGPTEREVMRARNKTWGRMLSSRLSRVNQAFYLGVDGYLGRDVGHDSVFVRQLEQVDIESVRRAASRYFRTDTYVLATAGRRP
ncbi:MAG TPA: pitrilysin family protein [Acidobacteriota bacterium]|nr:pitrilysin family protein [Acidobacteriota bacterium]